jgi:hypothetical protein
MAFINGDDSILGECFGYLEANALKNHWRGSSPPSNIQPGMIFSDEDDDKLYHETGGSGAPLEEILQETLSADKSPIFDNIFLTINEDPLSDPPTAAELAAIFGSNPGNGLLGGVKNNGSGGKLYLVRFYDGVFYYVEMTAAV